MRTILEWASVAALALLAWITHQALHGPIPLPDLIPTHFDAAGNANSWGPPSSLNLLPVVALGLYLLITVLGFFPGIIKYPVVRITPEILPRLESLSCRMIAWFKLELCCLFLYLQGTILQVARTGTGGPAANLGPIFLAIALGTVVLHVVAMIRLGLTVPREP
jgi:uncharacterized membrane protein